MDMNKLLDYAISKFAVLLNNKLSLVKKLFKEYVWNEIILLLGTLFLNYINNETQKIILIEKLLWATKIQKQ